MFNFFLFLFITNKCCAFFIKTNVSAVEDFRSSISLNRDYVPSYFDWRILKMVSPVKNQKQCNACWAFAGVANIESFQRIYRNSNEILSEQFLIDCDDSQHGCETGSILKTYANIISIFGGVLREDDYRPYSASKLSCQWSKPPPKPVFVIGFQRVEPDENLMVKMIGQYGPLSAGICSASMVKYVDNYIDEPTDKECDPKRLDHAVLIVGFNLYVSKDGKETPYWIVKNSWGEEWGDAGYYYLVRGRNACGIANDVSFPIV